MLQETEESEARSYTVAIFSDLFCQNFYQKNFFKKQATGSVTLALWHQGFSLIFLINHFFLWLCLISFNPMCDHWEWHFPLY